jgi:hypothetical protein
VDDGGVVAVEEAADVGQAHAELVVEGDHELLAGADEVAELAGAGEFGSGVAAVAGVEDRFGELPVFLLLLAVEEALLRRGGGPGGELVGAELGHVGGEVVAAVPPAVDDADGAAGAGGPVAAEVGDHGSASTVMWTPGRSSRWVRST